MATAPHIVTLHEYGALRHMLAVTHLADQGEISFEYVVGQIMRRGVGAVVRGKPERFPQILTDASAILRLLTAPPSTVIVGVAPYSTYVYLLELLKRRHHVVYYSSWPHWGPGDGVHHGANTLLRDTWLRWLDGVDAVGVTGAVRDSLASHGANARHIPHCVDTGEFTPPETARSGDEVEIVFCGRMVEHKGIRLLMECVERLASERVRWTFLGEGPMRDELLGMAERGFAVDAPGSVRGAQLVERFQRADILTLPSFEVEGWEELFGLVLIEAFACGLPVVAADCVGPEEIVDHGETGLLVPQRDVDALEKALRALIDDPAGRRAMGARARDVALERYSVEALSLQWRDVLIGGAGQAE